MGESYVCVEHLNQEHYDDQRSGNFYKSNFIFNYNCKDGYILLKKYTIKNISPYLKKVYL